MGATAPAPLPRVVARAATTLTTRSGVATGTCAGAGAGAACCSCSSAAAEITPRFAAALYGVMSPENPRSPSTNSRLAVTMTVSKPAYDAPLPVISTTATPTTCLAIP